MGPLALLFVFGDIGDTILTVPALRALRSRYPDTRLAVVSKRVPGRYLHELGLADQVVEIDKHLFDSVASLLRPRAWLAMVRLVSRLRHLRPDTVILFHHLPSKWGTLKFAFLSIASGAKRRVGVDNGRGWFLTERVPDKGFGALHESGYWLAIAAMMGAPGEPALEMPISEHDRVAARRLLSSVSGKRLVAIHPGTGWYGPGRRWDAENFVETARLVASASDARFVIVGTDQDLAEIEEVAQGLGGLAINLAGKTDLGCLAAVLERCSALIANDGGVSHIAAATGIPVIAIFGPSNERAWGPLGGGVVAADLACRPCFYRDFETGLRRGCATRECLTLVTPAMVSRAVIASIQEPAVAG
ncbi:MAG: glycosyltransferase family 9 protein [Chloroflexota bacterium]